MSSVRSLPAIAFSSCILASGLLTSSCMTFNASLQSARVLAEDESSQTLAGHLIEEVDSDVLKKRPFLDLGRQFDPNVELPFFGLSYHYRHGWLDDFDYGASLSFGLSALDIKKSFYDGEDLALGGGAKVLVPTLSLFYFESYFVGIPLYASYDLAEGLTAYFNPALYWSAARSREDRFLEISTGFILGNRAGVVVEWSFVDDPGSVSSYDRYRQFKVGYFWKGAGASTDKKPVLSLYPELGFATAPLPSIGILKRWSLAEEWSLEIGAAFAYSPLAETPGEIKRNFSRSNLSQAHLRYAPTSRMPFSFFAGLARREMGSTLETEVGWQRINALSFGPSFGIGQSFADSEIDWIGLYLPSHFLPYTREWTPLTRGIKEKTPAVAGMLTRYQDGPSVQLFRYRVLF